MKLGTILRKTFLFCCGMVAAIVGVGLLLGLVGTVISMVVNYFSGGGYGVSIRVGASGAPMSGGAEICLYGAIAVLSSISLAAGVWSLRECFRRDEEEDSEE